MIRRIISLLLQELVGSGDLVLVEGADLDVLAENLVVSAASTPIGSQFGSWLGRALLDSELVEELYADDKALNQYLKDLQP